MLSTMTTRLAALAVVLVLLTGCTPAESASPEPKESWTAPATVEAANIVTIEDGIAWARGLDGTASDDELSTGIVAIGELVPDLDIWFADNNEIGQKLIILNSDIHSGEGGSKVSRLNAIIDQLEASIEKGSNP